MNAWLLTWEGTVGPAIVPDKKVVAILSARRSTGTIEVIVDILYCRSVNTAHDMARLANKRKYRERVYKHLYSTPSRLFYGLNPCIFARIVSDLRIEWDENHGVEIIHWTEPAYYRVEKPGDLPVEVEPAREMQIARAIGPLSRDVEK